MDQPTHVVTGIYTAKPRLRATHSEGAKVTLTDGRQYIDLMNGKGCVTLGHHHPAVDEAIIRHLQGKLASATCWSDAHEQLADQIIQDLSLPQSSLAFFSTGTEACRAAMQVARKATGRRLVLSAGYHGWGQDWDSATELLSPNAAGVVDFYFIPELLERALTQYRGQVALVMMSPDYVHMSPEGLARLASITRAHGVLLCCDDVKQGYRSTAASAFPKATGQHADLYTFAKGLANGQRLSCLVGLQALMRAAKEFTYTAYFDTLPIVASLATLAEMRRVNGYQALSRCGAQIAEGMREIVRRRELPIAIYGEGPMLQIVAATEAMDQVVYTHCAAAGLLLYEGDNQTPSLATAEVLDELLERFDSALASAAQQLGPIGPQPISDRRRFQAAFCMMDGATDQVPSDAVLHWLEEER
ncbi:aminotransferase class III-fold pyridoxal phosphate-dependent enzyme [Roseateles sp. DB2]|uniref:aminotransferase class III-fold pyridoxal phosphate-dependent enzyme n=1 Tax=Roseateles sp. DB2 TaxID=3453717 RepID=UPI003EE97D76